MFFFLNYWAPIKKYLIQTPLSILLPSSEVETGIDVDHAEVVCQGEVLLVVLVDMGYSIGSDEESVVIVNQSGTGYEVEVDVLVTLVVDGVFDADVCHLVGHGRGEGYGQQPIVGKDPIEGISEVDVEVGVSDFAELEVIAQVVFDFERQFCGVKTQFVARP